VHILNAYIKLSTIANRKKPICLNGPTLLLDWDKIRDLKSFHYYSHYGIWKEDCERHYHRCIELELRVSLHESHQVSINQLCKYENNIDFLVCLRSTQQNESSLVSRIEIWALNVDNNIVFIAWIIIDLRLLILKCEEIIKKKLQSTRKITQD